MVALNLGTGVTPGADAQLDPNGIAGEAILAGHLVYEDPADNGRLHLASDADVNHANVKGVAIGSAPTVNQRVTVQYGGTVENTATMVVGESYFAADTPGLAAPAADVGAADVVTFLGVAVKATSLKLGIFRSGVAHA